MGALPAVWEIRDLFVYWILQRDADADDFRTLADEFVIIVNNIHRRAVNRDLVDLLVTPMGLSRLARH